MDPPLKSAFKKTSNYDSNNNPKKTVEIKEKEEVKGEKGEKKEGNSILYNIAANTPIIAPFVKKYLDPNEKTSDIKPTETPSKISSIITETPAIISTTTPTTLTSTTTPIQSNIIPDLIPTVPENPNKPSKTESLMNNFFGTLNEPIQSLYYNNVPKEEINKSISQSNKNLPKNEPYSPSTKRKYKESSNSFMKTLYCYLNDVPFDECGDDYQIKESIAKQKDNKLKEENKKLDEINYLDASTYFIHIILLIILSIIFLFYYSFQKEQYQLFIFIFSLIYILIFYGKYFYNCYQKRTYSIIDSSLFKSSVVLHLFFLLIIVGILSSFNNDKFQQTITYYLMIYLFIMGIYVSTSDYYNVTNTITEFLMSFTAIKNMFPTQTDAEREANKNKSWLETFNFNWFIPIILLIIFCILYSLSLREPNVKYILYVYYALLIIGALNTIANYFKDPNNKNNYNKYKTNYSQIFGTYSNVIFVIIYTLFLIIYYQLPKDNFLTKYADSKYTLLLTVIIGIYLFFCAFKTNYHGYIYEVYEKIKYLVLFFCLIVILINYYYNNPGGFIQQYFGENLLLLIIFFVLCIVSLIVIFTYNFKTNANTFSTSFAYSSFSSLKNSASLSNLFFGGFGLLACLIALLSYLFVTYPGGFTNSKASIALIPLTFLTVLLCLVLLFANLFTASNGKTINPNIGLTPPNVLKGLLYLLMIGMLIVLIIYVVINGQSLNKHFFNSQNNIIRFILNTGLFILVAYMIYNFFFRESQYNYDFTKFNPYYGYNKTKSSSFQWFSQLLSNEYKTFDTGNIKILSGLVVIILGYFYIPKLYKHFSQQGGKELIHSPISLNQQKLVSNHLELNKNDNVKYKYAVSFWVFVDSMTPNTNNQYDKYTSLLNYGGKPNILYNGKKGSLMVTFEDSYDKEKEIYNVYQDDNDKKYRIIYVNDNFPLQKWNNIVVNYDAGTLDIFFNGLLVKSTVEVVPYMKMDSLNVGENNGIKGLISNVIYYDRPLNQANIFYSYNFDKPSTVI